MRKRGKSRTSSASKRSARYRAKYQLNPTTKRYKKLLPVMYPQLETALTNIDGLEVALFDKYDELGIPTAVRPFYTAWAKQKGFVCTQHEPTTKTAEWGILDDEFITRGLDPDWLLELTPLIEVWCGTIKGIWYPEFYDGFDLGNLNKWSSTLDAVVDTSQKHHGAYSVKGTSPNGYVGHLISTPYPTLYYVRFWARFPWTLGSGPRSPLIFDAYDSLGNSIAWLWISEDVGKAVLALYSDIGYDEGVTDLVQNTWHCIEIRLQVGATATLEVYLDGYLEITQTGNIAYAEIAQFFLELNYPFSVSMNYDCVLGDPLRGGCLYYSHLGV